MASFPRMTVATLTKARLAIHRPFAYSGVKALPNTSCARAAKPQSSLAFGSLDPFARASGSGSQGEGTKNGLPAPNKEHLEIHPIAARVSPPMTAAERTNEAKKNA